jgi:L,D-peptidoglycan transpeptidase YkuD (ErfK/YbiS/YcfS/YnhG family)
MRRAVGKKSRIATGFRWARSRSFCSNPDTTLKELREAVELKCSLPAIHYALEEMGLTYKKRGSVATLQECFDKLGIGLHGTGEAEAPRKKEGDESSPAGVFRLFSAFGLADSTQLPFLRFPYEQITATTEAIDDPQSRYYNRIVDRAAIAHPDWSSSESMLRVGGALPVRHNDRA